MDKPKLLQMMLIDMTPIGSFRVFALLTELEHMSLAPFDNKIYWSDHNAIDPQGPFKTVWLAVENYKYVVVARMSTAVKLPYITPPPTPVDPITIKVLSLDEFRINKPKKDW